MRINIISSCIISLFVLTNNHHHENDSLETTKIKTNTQEELTEKNVKLIYTSNDLDCNQ